MKKHTSKEAYYERLKNLAEVNKTSIKESTNRNLGTLIDYKKAADGVNYGIIKENHHYYIKKGGLKNDPDVSDFAYIGGLSNITDFQYKTLHEADKNRNMLLHTITEATNLKPNANGGKKKLNEDKAGEEIDNAESKLDDLDAATAVADAEPAGDEIAAGLESEPADVEVTDTEEEIPAPDVDVNGGEEELPSADGLPDVGDEEIPDDNAGEEVSEPEPENDGDSASIGDDTDETTRELEKSIGKLTNTIRKTELEPSQVKSYLKSLIQSFKDKLPDLEIEDRKDIANLILKVVPPEDVEDLSSSIPNDEIEEEKCSECGGFAQYAESRGYDSVDALTECGEEEISNLVSGYANAHNDGMNDGDLDNVALVIKVVSPNVLDSLKNDYGHDEYAEKLTPYVESMNETSDEDNLAKLNELFGGLKSLGKAAVGGVKSAGQAVGRAAQQGVQKVKDAGQAITQTYHSGEVAGEIKKLEKYANELGAQVAALNTRLQKAGQPPVDTNKLIAGITNQLRGGRAASVAGTTAGSGLKEEMTDPANVEVQPNVNEDDEINASEIGFAPESQSLGGGVIKPDGATTTNVGVNINPDKSVSISMNEEKKPSAGMTKDEKSELVKKAKKGEDIGKEGKGFKDVANKAAKEYGSKEKGEKVAAAAMWKNAAKNEEISEQMNETELKIRKYIRARLEEKAGLKKAIINEDKKSETLKKLDKMIDEQFESYKKVIKK